MDQPLQETTGREYIDFEPETTTIQEEDCEILLVHVPGFQKEQLKVKLYPDGSHGTLSVTGEHEVENNKWSRAHKEYPLSENCDTQKISAKFETDTLRIRLPKLKKTPSDEPPPQTNNSGDSSHQVTPSMPGTTDQSKERNDKADNYEFRETQREGEKKTEKPISRDEPEKVDSGLSMNIFLIALLVLVLGFFASTWFGSSGK